MPAFDHVILQTKRLRLRPLREADAPGVLALFTDAQFMQFGTTPPFKSVDEAHALIARDMTAMAAGERLRLGITRQDDQTLIGIGTLFNLDAACRSAELGYGLMSDAWGQGYMHEGLPRESCIVNGVLTDSARYGLLQREWNARL